MKGVPLAVAALALLLPRLAGAIELPPGIRIDLESEPSRDVVIAVHAVGAKFAAASSLLPGSPRMELPALDTIVARITAEQALRVAGSQAVDDLEVVADPIAARVTSALEHIQTLLVWHDTGVFKVGVLNLSVGLPVAFSGRDLGAERTMRRALSALVRRNVPVVIAAGNDGPTRGLVNAWALTPGVFMVGAADRRGQRLADFSSRLLQSQAVGQHFVLGWGIDVPGARAGSTPKTPQEVQDDAARGLAEFVGRENVDRYMFMSGTSQAAAGVSRATCLVHQTIAVVRAKMDGLAPLKVTLPQFVRAYIDTAIDRTHPIFANRLADERQKFAGLTLDVDPKEKMHLIGVVQRTALAIRLEHGAHVAARAFRASAAPVPGVGPLDGGSGYVSMAGVAATMGRLTLADLADWLLADDFPKRSETLERLRRDSAERLLADRELGQIRQYCDDFDLVLSLALPRS